MKQSKVHRASPIICMICMVFSACASGSKTRLTFHEAQVPISMSRSIRDENGAIVKLKDLNKVGRFSSTFTVWSMFYKSVSFSPEKNISQEINKQVSKVQGEALVNFTVENRTCGLVPLPGLSILPFWPTCSLVTTSADIVSRKTPRVRDLSQ